MRNRTLSQKEWIFVSSVPTIQQTQSLPLSTYNLRANTTSPQGQNYTVRFVVASVPTKQRLFLRIAE
jgi:hypothetical protein